MAGPTSELTTAPAGSGKSYMRVRRIIDDYLPHSEVRIITDLPLRLDPWVSDDGVESKGLIAFVAKRMKVDEAEVAGRVEIIGHEEMQSWRNNTLAKGEEPRGPWSLFDDRDISGCRIIIDEVHNYCGQHSSKNVKGKWMEFLGELRHRGATFEGITQHPAKLAREMERECEVRRSLVNSESRRDPFFKIVMSDWYELRAAFMTGEYTVTISEIEKRKVDGKEKNEYAKKITRDPFYFQFYDSYNSPVAGGMGAQAEKHEFQKRSRRSLLVWFGFRNFFSIAPRMLLVAFVFWVCVMGGSKTLFAAYFDAWSGGGVLGLGGEVEGEEVGATITSREQADALLVDTASLPAGYVAGLDDVTAQELAMAHSRVAALEALVEGMEVERAEIVGKLDSLSEHVERAFAVALITHDSVTFRGGFTFVVGESIDWGPYEGQSVAAIDWGRRIVELSDGRKLRLGEPPDSAGWLSEFTDVATGAARVVEPIGADVSGSLQAIEGVTVGGSDRGSGN